jgi:hypothetical protein
MADVGNDMIHIRNRKETYIGIAVLILILAALLTFSSPKLGEAADASESSPPPSRSIPQD